MLKNYWKECIAEAFEDAGLEATEAQLDKVADWVEGAHDNFSMATGSDNIPNPLKLENAELQKKLALERSKVVCRECDGRGRIVIPGPYHSAETQCDECHGEGYVVR